jgi:transcriptional regulator with XRE-family HTH domain
MRDFWIDDDWEELVRLLESGAAWLDKKTTTSAGHMIRRLRRTKNIDQRDLAARSRVARSLIARLESGGDVRLSSLGRLLAALDCSLVLLPASESLLAEFRKRAKEKKRAEREWTRIATKILGRPPRFKPAPES